MEKKKEKTLKKLNSIDINGNVISECDYSFLKRCCNNKNSKISSIAENKLENIKNNFIELDDEGLPHKNIDDLCRVIKFTLFFILIFIITFLIF